MSRPSLRAELREVSTAWRGRAGPSAASPWRWTTLFAYPAGAARVARDVDGRVGGFLQLVPAPASAGLSLSSMRRRRGDAERPDGVPDRRDARLGEGARACGGLAQLRGLRGSGGRGLAARGRSASSCSGSTASSSSSGCAASARKFDPVWRPRYFCLERWTDLPAAGLAYLQAESLLTPPGPGPARPICLRAERIRPMKKLFATLILAAVVIPVAGARDSAGRRASASTRRASTRPCTSPSTRTEPKNLYVVEQAGVITILTGGRGVPTPFLDIRSLVKSGGEQRASVDGVPPELRRERPLLRRLHRPERRHPRRSQYHAEGGVARPRARSSCSSSNQPYDNHNGGQLQFGPDGLLYVGMGDGGSGGDPENRAQNLATGLGKLLKTNVAVARPAGRSPATACATRGASRSTARPATSGSATSARATGRRSTTVAQRFDRFGTTAGTSGRAGTATPTKS